MKPLSLICLCLLYTGIFAQKPTQNQPYQLVKNHQQVQYKNYYLLTLFQELPELKSMLQADPVLKGVLEQKQTQAAAVLKNCKTDISCYTGALKFSDEEIQKISNRLKSLYQPGNLLGKLVTGHLIPSDCYRQYHGLTPDELLIKAWEQDAKALNYTIGVYAEGRQPNYPKIDSISFNVRDNRYAELVYTNAQLSVQSPGKLYFEPTLSFALRALEINGRNDAGDFEPMERGVNKAALTAIRKTNWGRYPYTLILVPGEGPEDQQTELSAGGMLRCRLAAIQYQNGLAPFIMVSGGKVHPFKTKYNEAEEMKKFLINTLQIPESAILMEPHARHTTTNLRNAARIIFRYGIPAKQPALVVTSKSQSSYISDMMPARCIKDLGYVPYRLGKRLSETALEFYPEINALQIDADEPMDP